jgi:hypothetical protein
MSYKKIIKQMAAQAPKVYGEIPPMAKKRSSKNKKKKKKPAITMATATMTTAVTTTTTTNFPAPTSRRMSHVEDWIVVDSKESLPDEEDLVSQKKEDGWKCYLLM